MARNPYTREWARVWLALAIALVVLLEIIPELADMVLAALGAGLILGTLSCVATRWRMPRH